MYLLCLDYKNAKLNGSGQFPLRRTQTSITKWTLLDTNDRSLELLRLILTSFNSPGHLKRIPFSFNKLVGDGTEPLLTMNLRALHASTDKHNGRNPVVTGGSQISTSGTIQKPSQTWGKHFFQEFAIRNPKDRANPERDFILAYGDDFAVPRGDDAFDFRDAFFRNRRYHSLFSPAVSLTDPVAFLALLFFRGGKHKRLAPWHILNRICQLMDNYGVLNVRHWLQTPATAEQEWNALPGWLTKPFTLLLDAVRHTLDAFPKVGTPADIPGLILLHQSSRCCTDNFFPIFLTLMDELFPNMQFIMTVPKEKQHLIPKGLLGKNLSLPSLQIEAPRHSIVRKNVDVLLIDVDSHMPNLALMKLSRYFKQQGRDVMLARGVNRISSAREIYASCVFSSLPSSEKIRKLKKFYGDSLQLGGSGVDVQKRLPEEIEALPSDYGFYPELDDRAIGFLSRGCPLHCPFCIVPLKEGKPRQVSDLQTLLENDRRSKLILLDDNILSLPHADQLLEEMVSRNIRVNFTQTLDWRFVDRDRAALLRRVRCCNTRFTRSNYYFSLNDNRHLDLVREKYEMFGFSSRDNVEFVCMYGFNTTLAEDIQRFRFLRSLHGAYVFTQDYQPVPGGPPPTIDHFFEGDPDRLIEELIRILFTQNMKSMEKYYRWVSRKYAETFGKLHMSLVDTIFRYNQRHLKGHYIDTMAGLRNESAV
jgi:hypothetical protein